MFRYAFGRWWGNTDLATTAIWVLLNPATGDTEQRHRPTLERCISRSRAAGHTGLVIVNLFAFRDTNPRNLRSAPDAVGPANDEVLRVITKAGAQTIARVGRARPTRRALRTGRTPAGLTHVPRHHPTRRTTAPALHIRRHPPRTLGAGAPGFDPKNARLKAILVRPQWSC
jgi:hypothetical protein